MKYTKECKKQVNLSKTGWEICQSRGEIIIFAKQRGKCTETGKIGGNSKFVGGNASWSQGDGRPWY